MAEPTIHHRAVTHLQEASQAVAEACQLLLDPQLAGVRTRSTCMDELLAAQCHITQASQHLLAPQARVQAWPETRIRPAPAWFGARKAQR